MVGKAAVKGQVAAPKDAKRTAFRPQLRCAELGTIESDEEVPASDDSDDEETPVTFNFDDVRNSSEYLTL